MYKPYQDFLHNQSSQITTLVQHKSSKQESLPATTPLRT